MSYLTPLNPMHARLLVLETKYGALKTICTLVNTNPNQSRTLNYSEPATMARAALDMAYGHPMWGERLMAEAEAVLSTCFDLVVESYLSKDGFYDNMAQSALRTAEEEYGLYLSNRESLAAGMGERRAREKLIRDRLRCKYGDVWMEEHLPTE